MAKGFTFSQRENLESMSKEMRHTGVEFLKFPSGMKDVVVLPCSLNYEPLTGAANKLAVCQSYAVS